LGWLGWFLKNSGISLKNKIEIRLDGLAGLARRWWGRSAENVRARVAEPRLNSQIHARSAPARRCAGVLLENHHRDRPEGPSVQPSGILTMKGFKSPRFSPMSLIAVMIALLFWAPTASLAASASPAARHIEAYYQQLMPTLRAAGSLNVRERDRRFGPAITSAFDIGTMTRLAAGPAWSSFSGAQQAAVRDAFARFLVADYAHQVSDYSGESFVVDPQTSPEARGGGEIVKTQLVQPGGRTVQINYLVRGGRVVDVYLNGTVSDLATRRDEFASILAGGGGADALVKTLRERTENLLGS
jgi:phospholipid transport system substrate-binding protein